MIKENEPSCPQEENLLPARAGANREYKSDLFSYLFSDKPEHVIDLFNMLQGTHYGADTPVRIITLQNALFHELRDDLAFIIDGQFMVISEHQSTVNPNLPLRCYEYSAEEYIREIPNAALHRGALQQIPTPEFFVFYNGTEPMAEAESVLRLSDAFLVPQEQPMLELTVRVINLNHPANEEWIARCRLLHDYVVFVRAVQAYQRTGMALEQAIACAAKDCIGRGILKEYLLGHETEVAKHMKLEWGWEDVKEEHEREKEELRQQFRTQLLERDRQLDEQGRLLDEQNRQLDEMDRWLGEKDRQLDEQNRQLSEQNRRLDEKDRKIHELMAALNWL